MNEHGRDLDRRQFLAASAGAVAAAIVSGGRVAAAPPEPRIVVARGGAKMPADEAAYTRLKAALDKLGGFDALVKGKRVLAKINGTDQKIQDANTSTSLTAAVLRLCKERGAGSVAVLGQEWYGYDCPRAGQPTLREVIKAAGVELIELLHWWQRTDQYAKHVPKAGGWKELYVAKAIFEPDTVLLNVPRLKTHAFTLYTGCVKNIIGLTHHMYGFHCESDRDPEAGKSDQHPSRVRGWVRFPGKLSAAYHEVFRERIALNILDAGEPTFGWGGPKSEQCRTFPANAVIVGPDALACDAYGMRLLHEREPKLIPEALADWTQGDGIYVQSNLTKSNYLAECQKLGAGQADLSKVKIDEVAVD